jgi:hypothetical protein
MLGRSCRRSRIAEMLLIPRDAVVNQINHVLVLAHLWVI